MIKDGYGQGELDQYKPWLDIRTVPSHGYAHRVYGKTTKRTHELLSNGEKRCLSIFDWSPSVVDIQEQYPLLPLEETIEIAEQLGYKHPTDVVGELMCPQAARRAKRDVSAVC